MQSQWIPRSLGFVVDVLRRSPQQLWIHRLRCVQLGGEPSHRQGLPLQLADLRVEKRGLEIVDDLWHLVVHVEGLEVDQ